MQDPTALRRAYDRIADLLRRARKALPVSHILAAEANTDINRPGRSERGQDEFDKFMNVGEYEFAWVALISTAQRHSPQTEFWSEMAEAVVLLLPHARTPDFVPEARKMVRESDDLRAALTAMTLVSRRYGNERDYRESPARSGQRMSGGCNKPVRNTVIPDDFLCVSLPFVA